MKNNTPIFIVVAVVILVGLFFLLKPKTETNSQTTQQTASGQTITATKTVVMKTDSFEPTDFTIQKGTKVIFKNEDEVERWPASNIHPTHGIYPEFDPKQPVKPGEEWSFVFNQVGRWKYHDHLLPLLRGEITVIEGAVTEQPVITTPNIYELVIQGKKLVSGPATIKVTQGDEVTIKITSDESEEFHVHAYDNSVELEPNKEATLTFTAKLSGRFPFELENSKTEIGALEVQPK